MMAAMTCVEHVQALLLLGTQLEKSPLSLPLFLFFLSLSLVRIFQILVLSFPLYP